MPYMGWGLYSLKMKVKPTQIQVDFSLGSGCDLPGPWPHCARILLWTVTSVLQNLKIFEVLTFEFPRRYHN